ncbi:MAG: BadF/BadG/BcrA/BcrD ATPase family protein [Acidobacteriaceae bacterium]
MAFFLGIDAGGTKTRAALGDETRVLARATGGSIKPLRVSRREAQANLAAVLAEVARESGVDLREVSQSCVGAAGVRLPQTDGWVREILSACAGGTIAVCGDEEIALDAAFEGRAGVLAMAGTGSSVLGRTSAGELLTVGGWGPALGDQGSAYWIGHEALRAACRAKDFGQPTRILERVAKDWKASSVGEIVDLAHGAPDFSLLAPLIAACAEEGDAVAVEVLERGGLLLGEDAAEAFRQVRRLDPEEPMPGIAFTGSVLEKVALVRESMMETIRRSLPTVAILPEAVDPLMGALWRARGLAIRA